MLSVYDSAFEKANSAYDVEKPLTKALEKFQSQEAYRTKCFNLLEVKDKQKVIDGIDLLAKDLNLPETIRTVSEEPNF